MSTGSFGSLITTVGGDLTQLRKDLQEGRAELKKFYDDAARMRAAVGGAASLSGGRAGSAENSAAREARIAMKERMADLKQQILLARYLQQEEMKLAGARRAAENEQFGEERLHFRARLDMQAAFVRAQREAEAEDLLQMRARAEMQRDLDRQQVASARAAKKAQENSFSGRFSTAFQKYNEGNLKSLTDDFKQFTANLGTMGTGAAVAGFGYLVKQAFDISQFYERSKITVAEILTLTTDLVDKQGHVASGARQMAVNYQTADAVLQKVRKEAVRTVLTTQELMQNVTTNMGFAMAAGASPDRAVNLIARISNLAKSLGAASEREQGFEVRAMLTGKMLPRSRLGRVLGISSDQFKEADKAGTVLDMLEKKLKAGQPFLDRYAQSWQGLMTTLQSRGQEMLRRAFEQTFDRLRARLGDLNKLFSEKQMDEWAHRLSDALLSAYDAVDRFVKSDGFQNLKGFFRWIVGHADTIFSVFAAFKGLQVASAAQSVFGTMAAGKGLLGAGAAGQALGAAGTGFLAGLLPTALGLGIGTMINRETIGREEDRAAGTEADTQRMLLANPLAARMGSARRRKNSLREQYSRDITDHGMDSREARGTRGALDRAILEEQAAEAAITHFHRQQLQERENDEKNSLQRVSKLRAERLRAAKEAAEAERISVRKKLMEMEDDKIGLLRAQAEEDIRAASSGKKKVEDEKLRAELIAGIRAKLAQDVADEREKERLAALKQYAELTDNKRLQVQAEYEETVKGIQDDVKSENDRTRLLKAARAKAIQDLGKINEEEAVAKRELFAKSSGDEIAAIKLTAWKTFFERRREVKDQAELAKETVAIREGALREIHEKEREFQDKAVQLVHEYNSAIRDQAQERQRIERDVLDLQRRTAREAQQLVKDQIEAQKELKRARQDQPLTAEGVALNRAQRRDRQMIEQELLAQNGGLPPSLEQRQKVRELATRMASGDIFQANEAFGEAGKLGYLNEYNSQRVGGMVRHASEVGLQKGDLSDKQAEASDSRTVEDSQKAVEQAEERIKQLDVKQAELLEGYKESIQAIRHNFNKALEDSSTNLAKLSGEMGKLAGQLAVNHVGVAPGMLHLLRDAGKNGPALAGRHEGAGPVYNFIFNDGALKNLSPAAQDYLRQFGEELTKQALRTGPPRR